jgi:hypothetical protein
VLLVSCARSGDTSSDTQPSTPSVRAKTGWNRSAARVRSAKASGKNRSSADLAADADRDTSSSYMALFLIALSKIVGFEVSPVTERSSM